MGIAFNDHPVHKSAGIAFFGIADQVFLVAGRIQGHHPFLPCRITSATPASQLTKFNNITDLCGGIIKDRLVKGLISSSCY